MTSAYLSGIESIELNPSSPGRQTRQREYLTALGDQHDVYLGPWIAIEGGYLVVNAEDVPLVAAEWARRIREDGPRFHAALFRALLWSNDIQHGGSAYTWRNFDRDLRAGTVPDAIVDAVARLVSQRVLPGVPGDQVVNVTELLRSRVREGISPRQVARSLRPLEIEGALRGRSIIRNAARSGAAGDVFGGSLNITMARARAAMAGQPYSRTLGEDLSGFAISMPVSAASSALELRLTDSALQRAARGAPMPPYLRPGLVRVGLPAITAPLVTMGSMGIDSHSYPWQEYAVASTRSTVNALVAAGFLATVGAFGASGAEIGAVGGTAVEPGGGTLLGGAGGWLLGVIVGTGVYLVSDWFIGDRVEEMARSASGEPPGCPR